MDIPHNTVRSNQNITTQINHLNLPGLPCFLIKNALQYGSTLSPWDKLWFGGRLITTWGWCQHTIPMRQTVAWGQVNYHMGLMSAHHPQTMAWGQVNYHMWLMSAHHPQTVVWGQGHVFLVFFFIVFLHPSRTEVMWKEVRPTAFAPEMVLCPLSQLVQYVHSVSLQISHWKQKIKDA